MKRVIVAAFGVAGAFGVEAETTFEVPQGSKDFPTIGQINCLEEIGGTYCSAEWTCGEESGELWGDMRNHDGTRSLTVESPVARGRSCFIEVDGLAEVVWFTAHTPAGQNGRVVGLTPVLNPRAPVVRRVVESTASEGSLLRWMADERGLDLAEVRADACKHLNEHATDEQRSNCESFVVHTASAALLVNATPFVQCAVDWMLEHLADVYRDEPEGGYQVDALFKQYGGSGTGGYWLADTFGREVVTDWQQCREPTGRPYEHDSSEESRLRCCGLYREEAERVGFVWD